MPSTAEGQSANPVAQALVAFSLHNSFPEENVSSLNVGPEQLPSAIEALVEAKSKLEVCQRPQL